MKARWLALAAVVLAVGYMPTSCSSSAPVIGAKKFTENVILRDIICLGGLAKGVQTTPKKYGGTLLVFGELKQGRVSVYPEYTGTLTHEILKRPDIDDLDEIRKILAEDGIAMSEPLGFSNSYALAMTEELAEKKRIRKISDLQNHPELVFRFSTEFMNRDDSWPGLRKEYGLPQQDVRGMDHDLAYRELELGTADVIDVYTTDAKIDYYKLRVLEDDRHYFPKYDAVYLYRDDLPRRAPPLYEIIKSMEGRLTVKKMQRLNGQVEIARRTEMAVAQEFVNSELGLAVEVKPPSLAARIWKTTIAHLNLVRASLVTALIVAIPLGVFAAKAPSFRQVILGISGVIQAIPGFAMLAILLPVGLIPVLGNLAGSGATVIALFLYSLLPIVRNTVAGMMQTPAPLRESAEALGLSPWAKLWQVELPMASPTVLAGIKTAAVINVGFATLGAMIGSDGYGQPILTGLSLNDYGLVLEGAIPAAVMALVVQGLFEWSERWLVPKGLRLKGSH